MPLENTENEEKNFNGKVRPRLNTIKRRVLDEGEGDAVVDGIFTITTIQMSCV